MSANADEDHGGQDVRSGCRATGRRSRCSGQDHHIPYRHTTPHTGTHAAGRERNCLTLGHELIYTDPLLTLLTEE